MGRLHPLVKELHNQYTDALQRCRGRDEQARLERDAGRILGDLVGTLHDCRSFLEQNAKVQHGAFIHNVLFMSSKQGRMEELRSRVNFQMQKISFFLEAIKLEQTNALAQSVQRILSLLGSELPATLEPIPKWLDAKFVAAARLDPLLQSSDMSDFPLEKGWDALCNHFQNSVQAVRASRDRNGLQHLSLLKAHWIAQKIQQSTAFKALPAGSHYAYAFARLEQSILDECRAGFTRNFQSELLNFKDEDFVIWASPQTAAPAKPSDEFVGETKILELALPSQSATNLNARLMCFRESPTQLRLVRVSETSDSSQFSREIFVMNIHHETLVPLYAFAPPKSPTSNTIQLGATTMYTLAKRPALFMLQRAITGFEVMSDLSLSRWYAHKPYTLTRANIEGSGRVQLWIRKPLSSFEQEPMSPDQLQRESPRPVRTSSAASSTPSLDSSRSTITQSAPSNTHYKMTNDGKSVVFSRNIHPVLVIFSRKNHDYGMVYVKRMY